MALIETRQEYGEAGLNERDLSPDPIEQFARWFGAAVEAGLHEPNAMTLATATPDGLPSARMVLLKSFDAQGFVFYTNYDSQKGRELAANPRAALVFYWPPHHRQVRVAGVVSQVSRAESEAYFHSRPIGARLSALASRQSRVIPNREFLEQRVAEMAAQYPGENVPLPEDWGGYRLRPHLIEFWQGRPNRLHDRLRYTRPPGGNWVIERLSP
jgi:pyridoxamine 5'-phosphate oxidase